MARTGEDPVRTALRNELILQEIFNFLPQESLLTSSQVNKFWNAQVRTYIRDHRICTAFISSETISPCDVLQQFDQDLAIMAIIPFNSLDIDIGPHRCPYYTSNHRRRRRQRHRLKNGPMTMDIPPYENTFTKLNLKYMCISCEEDEGTCPVTFFIFRLLADKSSNLKVLRCANISTTFANFFTDKDKLDFPRLEELEILYTSDWLNHGESLLQKILDGAPKLVKITHGGERHILKILRENQYRLLRTLEFSDCFYYDELNKLTWNFVQSGPRLSELRFSYGYTEIDIPTNCHSLFHSLVQSSSSSLEHLRISCASHLSSSVSSIEKVGQFPPLPNVTFLSLRNDKRQPFEYLDQFQVVRFGELFPKLEKVDLEINYYDTLEFPSQSASEVDREFSNIVAQDPAWAANTVKSLKFNSEVCPVALLQLKKSFPNVTQLEISAGSDTGHAVPYGLIFRFWPNLKTLAVNGSMWRLRSALPNCDAEFCGINPEEVELLWGKEEEYLRNVHIVPVRPSVSTMRKLESLSITFLLRDPVSSNPRLMFLSPVTEFIVFKRMPQLNLSFRLKSSGLVNEPASR